MSLFLKQRPVFSSLFLLLLLSTLNSLNLGSGLAVQQDLLLQGLTPFGTLRALQLPDNAKATAGLEERLRAVLTTEQGRPTQIVQNLEKAGEIKVKEPPEAPPADEEPGWEQVPGKHLGGKVKRKRTGLQGKKGEDIVITRVDPFQTNSDATTLRPQPVLPTLSASSSPGSLAAAGLEEKPRFFESVDKFKEAYPGLMEDRSIGMAVSAFQAQGAAVVRLVSGGPVEPAEARISVYAYNMTEEDQNPFVESLSGQLKDGVLWDKEKVIFYVRSYLPYLGRGNLGQPPRVLIRKVDSKVEPWPDKVMPTILISGDSDIPKLTPDWVRAVAEDETLNGKLLGPVIGVIRFRDENGQVVHAIFSQMV